MVKTLIFQLEYVQAKTFLDLNFATKTWLSDSLVYVWSVQNVFTEKLVISEKIIILESGMVWLSRIILASLAKGPGFAPLSSQRWLRIIRKWNNECMQTMTKTHGSPKDRNRGYRWPHKMDRDPTKPYTKNVIDVHSINSDILRTWNIEYWRCLTFDWLFQYKLHTCTQKCIHANLIR